MMMNHITAPGATDNLLTVIRLLETCADLGQVRAAVLEIQKERAAATSALEQARLAEQAAVAAKAEADTARLEAQGQAEEAALAMHQLEQRQREFRDEVDASKAEIERQRADVLKQWEKVQAESQRSADVLRQASAQREAAAADRAAAEREREATARAQADLDAQRALLQERIEALKNLTAI